MDPKTPMVDLLDADLQHDLCEQRIKKEIAIPHPQDYLRAKSAKRAIDLPLLSVAACFGDATRLDQLLAISQFDVNVVDNMGCTPIQYAVTNGRTDCVK